MDICFDETTERWDAFVAKSPQRTIFVTSAFLRSLGTPFSLVTCTEQGRIVAGAPILFSAPGQPMADVHRFTLYQGLIHEDNSSDAKHHRVKHELDATEFFVQSLMGRYPRCCLTQSWRTRDLRGFLWHNYHQPERGQFSVSHCHTGIIDLASHATFDDYLGTVRKVRRQDWRKGSALDIHDVEDVSLLDRLHEMTYARQGIVRDPTESGLIHAITRAALAGGYGQLACAYVGGTPASITLFLYDDRTAFYMFGANDPEFRSSPASSALLLHLIRAAHARGLREVDMMGMNSPARGDYKLSFNADVESYVTLRCGT